MRSGSRPQAKAPEKFSFQISPSPGTDAPWHCGLAPLAGLPPPGPGVLLPGLSHSVVPLPASLYPLLSLVRLPCSCPHRPPHFLPQHLHLPLPSPPCTLATSRLQKLPPGWRLLRSLQLPHPQPLLRLFSLTCLVWDSCQHALQTDAPLYPRLPLLLLPTSHTFPLSFPAASLACHSGVMGPLSFKNLHVCIQVLHFTLCHILLFGPELFERRWYTSCLFIPYIYYF